jgi:hypothetical protein
MEGTMSYTVKVARALEMDGPDSRLLKIRLSW